MIVLHLQGAVSSIYSYRSSRASLNVCKKSSLPREVGTILAHAGHIRLRVAEKQVVLSPSEIRIP
jgi:hypothetical protein